VKRGLGAEIKSCPIIRCTGQSAEFMGHNDV
jgi:hypothetical protein